METLDLCIGDNQLDISSFTGEPQESQVNPTAPPSVSRTKSTSNTTDKPAWVKGAESYQDLVRSFTDYGADKSGYGYYEKYSDPQGRRKRILGLEPFTFVAVSLVLIIASGIAIVYLKPKK